ncbi:hypothetical protein [Novosphingobium sp. Chol11]|uniref:hypothetical protein n=1 Tax=Novosphingobium sp. Chol11 TaxID=1385763 RepID=UPI0025E25C64|nr:hypothetical protein [Novosphingobium sp. Chol11]
MRPWHSVWPGRPLRERFDLERREPAVFFASASERIDPGITLRGGGIPNGSSGSAGFGQGSGKGGDQGLFRFIPALRRAVFIGGLIGCGVIRCGVVIVVVTGGCAPVLIELRRVCAIMIGGGAPVIVFGWRCAALVVIGPKAQRGAQGLLGFGDFFGDMFGAAGKRRGPPLPFGQRRGIGLAAEQRFEKFIEAPAGGAGALGLVAMLVEPGEVREQQAAIEAHAAADRLAPVKDRLAGAVHRAVGEYLFRRIAREHQRRLPPLRQRGIAPLVHIGRLRRQPDLGAGDADIAVRGEVMKELHLPRGREGIGAGGLRIKPLPLAGGGGVRLLRLPRAGGGRVGERIHLVLSNVPTPGPSRRREGGGSVARNPSHRRERSITPRNCRDGIIRQPDIPLRQYPPPPEPAAALAVHPCDSRWNKNGTMAWMGGCRTGVWRGGWGRWRGGGRTEERD